MKFHIKVLEDGNTLSEDWRALCQLAGGATLRRLSHRGFVGSNSTSSKAIPAASVDAD